MNATEQTNNTNNDLSLIIAINNQLDKVHYHTGKLELLFMLKGTAELLINNTSLKMKEGDLHIINADNYHMVRPGKNCVHISIFLNLPVFNKYIPGIQYIWFDYINNESSIEKNDTQLESIKAMYFNIIKASIDSISQNTEYITNQAVNMLIDLKNRFILSEFNISKESQSDRLWEILDYIYDNCTRRLPLDEVAEHVNLAPNYLSHYIKKACGKTYQELVNYLRSEIALKLLYSSEDSLSTISLKAGFSAFKYFVKYFTNTYGISPQEYRDNYKDHKVDHIENSIQAISYDSIKHGHQGYIRFWINRYATYDNSIEMTPQKIEITPEIINDALKAYDTTVDIKRELVVKPATCLIIPSIQKILYEAVKELNITQIQIIGSSALNTTEKTAVEEILRRSMCRLAHPNSPYRHDSLHLLCDDKSNISGLYDPSGVKTPLFFYAMLCTKCDGGKKLNDMTTLLPCTNGDYFILFDNYNSTDTASISFDLQIKDMKENMFLKTVFTLDKKALWEKNKEAIIKSAESIKQQLNIDICAPAISHEIITCFGGTLEFSVELLSKSAILIHLKKL